jgi:RNA polymerase sigma-70 factor (ECF subfamily)
MYGVCLRYVKNRDDAMDILHDGFIKVFSSLDGFRFTGSLEGWIRRIMVHTAINYYNRRLSKKSNNFEEISGYAENNTPDAISEMSASELIAHVQQLPDGYRMVFNLFAIEGYQHDEIAEMLNISQNTSKTQLMKARRMLMSKIKNKVYETL